MKNVFNDLSVYIWFCWISLMNLLIFSELIPLIHLYKSTMHWASTNATSLLSQQSLKTCAVDPQTGQSWLTVSYKFPTDDTPNSTYKKSVRRRSLKYLSIQMRSDCWGFEERSEQVTKLYRLPWWTRLLVCSTPSGHTCLHTPGATSAWPLWHSHPYCQQ